MQDAHQIRLEVPSSAEYVAVVRHAICGIADRMRFTSTEVDELRLAVGEACTNAVKHGCHSKSSPYVTVVCKMTTSELEIEVSNGLSGTETEPKIADSITCQTLEDAKEGGMGLYLMQHLMDEVNITWGEKACIRMIKRRGNGDR